MSTAVTTTPAPNTHHPHLSLARVNLMRGGYAFMGVGLALVKWPLLADAYAMPLWEGIALALLTAMSLLAFLGLPYPVKFLPVLLFETTWKLLWLSLVALPTAIKGDVSNEMSVIIVNCSFVVLIMAVTPWRYVWTQYVRTSGERWRR